MSDNSNSVTEDNVDGIAEEWLRQIMEADRERVGSKLTTIAELVDFSAEICVAPHGADENNDGTPDAPLASLEAARDHVRALRAGGLSGNVLIKLAAGRYSRQDTFRLEKQDGGTADATVVYRAEAPGQVILSAGRTLTEFAEVTEAAILDRLPEESRGHVLYCALGENGIESFGDPLPSSPRGKATTHSTLELFVNGERMPLAQWPKAGWSEDSVVIPDHADEAGDITEIQYKGDRPLRWRTADQAQISGYLRNNWLDTTFLLDHVDPEGGNLVTAAPFMNRSEMNIPAYPGIPADHKMRYSVVNLLEELSEPGEWFLDRKQGRLYLYPPTAFKEARIEVSALPKPMVVAEGVSHVRFEGLVFELGQQDAVHLLGSSDCLMHHCTIRRMAGGAVNIEGGKRNRIQSCELHTLGRNGTWISGGDRRTLEPCGHVIENCHIHHFSRLEGTYAPAVKTDGVGIRIAHNHMHHTSSSALRVDGNDHVVEYNDIHDAVIGSDDQGAIDVFGNPTFRGCIYRYNYFHHIGSERSFAVGGIRGDDCISGMVIYGNIFFQASDGHFGGVQINSGRENIVSDNLFVDCKTGVSGGWTPGWSERNHMWKTFYEGKSPTWTEYIMSDLYLARYPLLHRIQTDKPINFIWRNTIINSAKPIGHDENHTSNIDNQIEDKLDHGFDRPTAPDLLTLLPSDSALKALIPAEKIGCDKDSL